MQPPASISIGLRGSALARQPPGRLTKRLSRSIGDGILHPTAHLSCRLRLHHPFASYSGSEAGERQPVRIAELLDETRLSCRSVLKQRGDIIGSRQRRKTHIALTDAKLRPLSPSIVPFSSPAANIRLASSPSKCFNSLCPRPSEELMPTMPASPARLANASSPAALIRSASSAKTTLQDSANASRSVNVPCPSLSQQDKPYLP